MAFDESSANFLFLCWIQVLSYNAGNCWTQLINSSLSSLPIFTAAILLYETTSCLKTRPAQKLLVRVKFTGNQYSYRTRISVNGCHWNTCKLLFILVLGLGLALVSMWMRPKSLPCFQVSKQTQLAYLILEPQIRFSTIVYMLDDSDVSDIRTRRYRPDRSNIFWLYNKTQYSSECSTTWLASVPCASVWSADKLGSSWRELFRHPTRFFFKFRPLLQWDSHLSPLITFRHASSPHLYLNSF